MRILQSTFPDLTPLRPVLQRGASGRELARAAPISGSGSMEGSLRPLHGHR